MPSRHAAPNADPLPGTTPGTAGAAKAPAVLVVGSLNHDIVVQVDHRPAGGETVVGTALAQGCGGKGGNQAVAAALTGVGVAMLGAVGADREGDLQLGELGAAGVDVSLVVRSESHRTSMALITVTPDAENSIVVTPGANDLVTPDRMAALPAADSSSSEEPLLGGLSPQVVLAQSEIGAAACDAAAGLALRTGARFVFSNGPVVPVTASTWALCDPVVLNRHEACDALQGFGVTASCDEDPGRLARLLAEASGARSVVVTSGAHGSAFGPGPDGAFGRLPATHAVSVVDTTGAGDTYTGVLAAALAQGESLARACEAGSIAAARSVSWPGARPAPGA